MPAESSDPQTPPPTRQELRTAYGRTLPDLVGPEMQLVLVGINPSLLSAWRGYHFARPGNRLWPTLHAAGFTSVRFDPAQQEELLPLGIGITNLVARATARADELTADELRAGVAPLTRLIRRWRPPWVAFLGLSAYRSAFNRPRAVVGLQDESLAGARVWLLPNPSGLNAHYQQDALTAAYAQLRRAAFG